MTVATLSHCFHTRRMVWTAHCQFSAVRCSSPSSAFSSLLQPWGQDTHSLPFLTSESQQHFLSWPFQLLSLLWLLSESFSFKVCWVKRVITSYGAQATFNELNSYVYIVSTSKTFLFHLKNISHITFLGLLQLIICSRQMAFEFFWSQFFVAKLSFCLLSCTSHDLFSQSRLVVGFSCPFSYAIAVSFLEISYWRMTVMLKWC